MALATSATGFTLNDMGGSLAKTHNLMKSALTLRTFQRLKLVDRFVLINHIRQLIIVDFPHTRTMAGWLIHQLESDSLTEYRLMIIEDTIHYLKTGRRKYPLTSSEKILIDDLNSGDRISKAGVPSSPYWRTSKDRIKNLTRIIREMELEHSLFYRWAKTENGLQDLIQFMCIASRPE